MTEKARIIGRSQSADFVIPSSRVSRRHCSIIPSGDGFVLQDHDSRNGVWVDGRRVKTAFLHRGSRFSVGEYRVRIARDGSLVLEEKTDPKKMLLRDKVRDGLPAVATLCLIIGLAAIPLVLNRSPSTEETISSANNSTEPLTPWTPNQEDAEEKNVAVVESTDEAETGTDALDSDPADQASVASIKWSTSSGREWTLEELLTLAEAIENTGQPTDAIPDTGTDPAVVPALDPEEIVIPSMPNPWAEVARLRKEGKMRQRRGTAPDHQASGRDDSTTEVVVQHSVEELLEMGREALTSYHVPDEVMPGFSFAISSLRELRHDEAWFALETLRQESRDLLRAVASRARQIGKKYGHLDRNPDAPLSPKDRRESELALNLLVLIQEQMEILLQARDAALAVLANPDDPELLAFALSVSLEDDEDELLDVVLGHGIAEKTPELLPVLIRGLQVPSATRKLKVRNALQKMTGENFRSVSEWERWLKTREGSSP
ncbi:MAG: FHA domain-containing protein [Planctomycetota bacterium]|nr:FHA domain-containing protein [Planctomycetota bacterium]